MFVPMPLCLACVFLLILIGTIDRQVKECLVQLPLNCLLIKEFLMFLVDTLLRPRFGSSKQWDKYLPLFTQVYKWVLAK